ncbi:MAG: 30S ribosomal protein S12 methylthiotransferase RimO [Thermoleophilia bacterium]|nr:30S ribosomal protein S12 methylthiotransferase RimO [Thermoleophilia bacterium]
MGCPKNEADSRGTVRSLLAAGAEVVADPDEATHIVVNTCGFIQDAKEESVGAILDACARYPEKTVLGMGCLVERYREELQRGIPEVAGWFGLPEGPGGLELLRWLGLGATRGPRERAASYGASYAYLKISDGCDEPCTFCAIPGIKGAYRSLGRDEILREADACLTEGARELVLVGQDTAVWSGDGLDLAGLIDLLAADQRVRRIRVLYLQPEHVTDGFLEYMAGQPRLCRYLDVPFQHSDPEVLRRMGRWGDGEAYLRLLERARGLMPDVAVRSTFIVGFPGESDAQFGHLLRFVDDAGFDYAGGFVYSPEEGTKAATLRPRVGRAVARRRLNRLSALLAERAESRHHQMAGARVEVMIDSFEQEDESGAVIAVGRTPGQAPEVDGVTYVEGGLPEGTAVGDIVTVAVNAALGYDLVATCDAA